MLRNVLFCASLALALTLTAGCKKEEKAGKVDLNAVEGTYEGYKTRIYDKNAMPWKTSWTREERVVVKRLDGKHSNGVVGDFSIDGTRVKIKSNENGKLTLTFDSGLASGEAVITGSELTYKASFDIYTEEFKGKKVVVEYGHFVAIRRPGKSFFLGRFLWLRGDPSYPRAYNKCNARHN